MSDELATASVDASATTSAPGGAEPSAPASVESAAGADTTSTPVAQPEAVFTPPEKGVDEDGRAYLQRATEARTAFEKEQEAAKQAGKTAEVKPAEPAKPEETKPEEKAAEPAKEEAKAEEKPEAEEAEPPLSIDDKAPLPPRELAAKLKADPELDAKLEAAGIKAEMFQNARLAAKTVAFQEAFPGGLEDAIYAKDQATAFGKLDDIFTNIKTGGIEAVDQFIGAMSELDVVVDDAGKPVLGEDGRPVQQGHVASFLSHIGDHTFNLRMDHLERMAKEALKANPDDEDSQILLSAVDAIKARTSGSAPAEKLTDIQKAEQQRLDSERAELARTREAEREAKHQEREDTITRKSDEAFDKDVLSVLKQTDLRPEQHSLILAEIRERIANKLASDPMFTSKRDWIMRAQWSPGVEQKRMAHNFNSMRASFGPVAREVFTKYGIKQIQQQAERKAKIDTQIKASRTEPKSTGVAPAPRPLSSSELADQARENLKAAGRDETDSRLLLREMRKLQGTLA